LRSKAIKSKYGKVGLALLLIAGVGGIMGGLGVSDPLNTPQADMPWVLV
jgi:hypothetical protein